MSAEARYVFDTNTLVSAICFPRSFGRRAFEYALVNAILVACFEMLVELLDAIARSKFDRFANLAKRMELAAIYAR